MLKVSPIAQVPGFTQKFGTGSGRNNARGRSRGNPMENLATSNSARLTGLKVLVIDDSKTIRRTAETLLAKEGCEVFTAVDGFDALSKIADHQPDIVFVDIMMPRLDGYQTCSLIKHNKVFRSIPVINRRLRALPDQAVHQRRAAECDRDSRWTTGPVAHAWTSDFNPVGARYGPDPHRR
jgi:CheY-like chemotaxis protein